MKDMTKITEEGKKLIKVLRTILVEQTEEEEYYKISPQEFEELMKLSGYHGKGLSKIKKFQGKPIWVTLSQELSSLSPMSIFGRTGAFISLASNTLTLLRKILLLSF